MQSKKGGENKRKKVCIQNGSYGNDWHKPCKAKHQKLGGNVTIISDGGLIL